MTGSPLPLILVTGVRGSGKTALIDRLLAVPGYGDSAVIAETPDCPTGGRPSPLAGVGCLCCAPTPPLVDRLRRLFLDQVKGVGPPIARVVVETADDTDPAALRAALLADRLLAARYRVATIIAVVDGRTGAMIRSQIAAADHVVILGDIDAAGRARLDRAVAALKPAAGHAVTRTEFDPGLLAGAPSPG